MFDSIGRIWFQEQDQVGVDDVLDEGIEAGAIDISNDEGRLVVDTDPANVVTVSAHLQQRFELSVERTEVLYVPKDESMVELDSKKSQEVQAVLSLIEDEPSLQNL